MADKDNLSDGELEDGEVLSSEEEEEGPGNPKDLGAEKKENVSHDIKDSKGEEGEKEEPKDGYSDEEETGNYHPNRPKNSHSMDKSERSRTRSPNYHRGSPMGGGKRREEISDHSRRSRRRSPRRKYRSSDDEHDRSSDGQDSSSKYSSELDRDNSQDSRGSSTGSRLSGGRKEGGRGGGGSDTESDSHHHHHHHHHGNHYGNKGGRGRKFGGYSHSYQQRGSKYVRGSSGRGGGNYGGYSNRNYQANTEQKTGGGGGEGGGGEDIIGRLQRGLSLLPPPKEPQCGNLDQFNYPAPPSWYLQEVEEWEKREKQVAPVRQDSVGEGEGQLSIEAVSSPEGASEVKGQEETLLRPHPSVQGSSPSLVVPTGYVGSHPPLPGPSPVHPPMLGANPSLVVPYVPPQGSNLSLVTSGYVQPHPPPAPQSYNPSQIPLQTVTTSLGAAGPHPASVSMSIGMSQSLTLPPTHTGVPTLVSGILSASEGGPHPPFVAMTMDTPAHGLGVTSGSNLLPMAPPTVDTSSDPLAVPGGVAREEGKADKEEEMEIESLVINDAEEEGVVSSHTNSLPPLLKGLDEVGINRNPINEAECSSKNPVNEAGQEVGNYATENGCVAGGEEGVAHVRPLIEEVNPQEKVIKFSEITRMQVTVLPVDHVLPSPSSLPQLTSETMAAPAVVMTSQNTTPTPNLQSASLSSTIEGKKSFSVKEEEDELTYSLRSRGRGNSRKRAGSSLQKPAPVRPKLIGESDVNYDDYLDQLLEEEEEEEGEEPIKKASEGSISLSRGFPPAGKDSFADQIGENFPILGSGPEETLESLINRDLPISEESPPGSKSAPNNISKRKSLRRRQKESSWWSKQKENEAKAVEQKNNKGTCRYFLNGFCKNGDTCEYSHDGLPNKRREICKFYVVDNCSKGDDCSFYHGDFPCKFFHTKSYCKNGNKCKYSHDPLTATTRDLLLSVVDPHQIISPDNLVVSIPKPLADKDAIIVSIPLTKLDDRIKLKSFSIPKLKPDSSAQLPQQQDIRPGVSSVYAPFYLSTPLQTQVQHPTQSHPVPLFPMNDPSIRPPPPPLSLQPSGSVAPFTSPQGPNIFPPPAPPPMTTPPNLVPPIGENSQRRFLLPTPPPSQVVLPEDFKKLRPMEYWEDPSLPPKEQQSCEPLPPPAQLPQGPNQLPQGPNQLPQGPNQLPQGPYQLPHGQTQLQGPSQMPPQGPYQLPQGPSQLPQGANQLPSRSPAPPHQQDPRHQGAQFQSPLNQTPHHSSAPHITGNHGNPGSVVDPRQSRLMAKEEVSDHTHPRLLPPPEGQWQQNKTYPPGHPDQRLGDTPPLNSYQQRSEAARLNTYPPGLNSGLPPLASRITPCGPGQDVMKMGPYGPPHPPHHYSGGGGGFQAPPIGGALSPLAPPLEHHIPPSSLSDKSSPSWGMGGRSPERSPISHHSGLGVAMGGAKKEGETRKVDPRMKYSHLKIKSKGSNTSSQSTILKRPEESSNPNFKIPKLLQNSSSLERPMDARDLFKGEDGGEGGERGYGDISASFGMFKSNFFSTRSELQDGASNIATTNKQPFGEITMKKGNNGRRDSTTSSNENNGEMKALTTAEKEKEGYNSSDKGAVETDDTEEDTTLFKPTVPSYLAHLDVGLGNDDLKIDSAFGSLAAGKADGGSGNGEGGATSDKQHDSQARKLPSMFGLGF